MSNLAQLKQWMEENFFIYFFLAVVHIVLVALTASPLAIWEAWAFRMNIRKAWMGSVVAVAMFFYGDDIFTFIMKTSELLNKSDNEL